MSPETLTAYLHRSIPLTAAMKMTAVESSQSRIALRCPISPNVNHHQTAFGGSLAAAMMLAGWAMMRVRMGAAGLLNTTGLEWSSPVLGDDSSTAPPANPTVRLVVSKTSTDFLHPVTNDFVTECRFADEVTWDRFVERFRANHWAKLRLQSQIIGETDAAARMKSTYVAVNGNGPADYL